MPRKSTTVLLTDMEKAEVVKALREENRERGLELGLSAKLRELALLWARRHNLRVGVLTKWRRNATGEIIEAYGVSNGLVAMRDKSSPTPHGIPVEKFLADHTRVK